MTTVHETYERQSQADIRISPFSSTDKSNGIVVYAALTALCCDLLHPPIFRSVQVAKEVTYLKRLG